MGLAAVCDMAWVVLSDRVRQTALVDRQAVTTAGLLAGALERLDVPDPDAAVADFAAALARPPAPRAANHRLRLLLGVA